MIHPAPKPEPRAKRPRKPLRKGSGPARDSARMAFVRDYPCTACTHLGRRQRSHSQADHIRTRGAGGSEAGNLWALCAAHHDERHRLGLRAFEYQTGLHAKTWGLWYEAEYVQAHGG